MATLNCSCGYYDAAADVLYTDSIIVYFNETFAVPDNIFLKQAYENPYEKDWNARYRQGADPSNVQIANETYGSISNTLLELYVAPPTPGHLVVGGGLQTLRRDIQYGSFRAYVRSPQRQAHGGSSLSMAIVYNDTQRIMMNVQNTDEPESAWVSMLLADEFPDRTLGVNFTTISNSSLVNSMESPWSFMEIRIDWLKDKINYHVGDNLTRSISADETNLLNVPAPLYLKHWSVGNDYTMQGPPKKRSVANVGWLRFFFNSSTMLDDSHALFDMRCTVVDACSVDDMSLRASTAYSQEALLVWQRSKPGYSIRWVAIDIAILCLCFTFAVVLNMILGQFLERRSRKIARLRQEATTPIQKDFDAASFSSGTMTPHYRSEELSSMPTLVPTTPVNITRQPSINNLDAMVHKKGNPGIQRLDELKIEDADWPTHHDDGGAMKPTIAVMNRLEQTSDESPSSNRPTTLAADIVAENLQEIKPKGQCVQTTQTLPMPLSPMPIIPPHQRVDYLAGLVALCSLLVTFTHFVLTFIPAVVIPDGMSHYGSEDWIRKIIGPYIFNQIWVGLFFATSTRFLVATYLRSGDLGSVAEKVVSRVPRFFLPVTALILLEYFLIDCGSLHWLQYLPSVTWSTWPYAVEFANFGIFINELLGLLYTIPNAVPRIIFNYCVGVLWTIPVQLQGSWTALLGAVLVYELRSPWKRFGYYTLCIVANWYAESWGSIFWFGLLLTDLDITYKYRRWLYARPLVYYPLLSVFIFAGFAGLSNDLIAAWTSVNYAVIEHNIHPDVLTGLPLAQTPNAGFPQYYVPRISALLFCAGWQAVVELSPLVQKMLSVRILQFIFPHIFTIYLFQGFVFWSVGAMACCFFASRGFPYWLNMLLVAVCSYATLALSVCLITPVIGALAKDVTANVWRMGHVTPVQKKATLWPFGKDLILQREGNVGRGGKLLAKNIDNGTEKEMETVITEGNIEYVDEVIAGPGRARDEH